MAGFSLLLALAFGCGAASAAERAVAPVEIAAPLAVPAAMNQNLAGSGGWLNIPGLQWRGADSPAALAAQFLLPPSVIVNFAAPQARRDAAFLAPGQATSASPSAASSQSGTAAAGGPVAAVNPMASGAEAGVIPIEALGEGTRPGLPQSSQDRLSESAASLRAPLGELRDAPADGGESLHSVASRVWDMMSGRRAAGAFASPSAGRSAFAPLAAASGRPQAVPGAAAQAPLSLKAAGPLGEVSRLAPASIALVLMDVFGQRLNLTSSPIPRLKPGPGTRGAFLAEGELTPAGAALESTTLGAEVPAPYLGSAPRPRVKSAGPDADLPASTWRAQAEWVSFGESGLADAEGPPAAAPGGAAASPVAAPVSALSTARPSPVAQASPSASALRRHGSFFPPASAGRGLEAALPLSALAALAGLALLAWPESR